MQSISTQNLTVEPRSRQRLNPRLSAELDTHEILVVDDESIVKSMIQQCVQWAGYPCAAAADGNEALEVLASNHIDVVITDINMPGIDGIELTRRIKAQRSTDVIIMTGYIQDFRYEDIVDIGASDFIQKPVSVKELIVRLKRVLRERTILKERNRAEKDLKYSLGKLSKAFGGIIQAMAQTIEHRDPYTAGHQRKVADLAEAIAREIGLSENRIEGLRMAGLIHDLGKISIPSEILAKPRFLSELEFGLMKTHPQVAFEILNSIEFPWSVADIVYQHHERINGNGYPRGITARDILPEARILAVADVVEAMASHRPYRPTLGIRSALDEVAKHRSVLYDRHAVDACLNLFTKKGYRFNRV